MTLRTKIEIFTAVALIAGGVLGFRSWLGEHDLRVHAEEAEKAAQGTVSQAAASVAVLQKQIADRDAEYQSQLKTLDTKFSQAASPAALAQVVSQLMGLKQPIQVVTPAANGSNANPAPVAQVPQIDFPQAKAYLQECEQCKLDNAKLTADAATRAQEQAAAQKQIDALNGEVKTLQAAAKGGSLLHRIGSGAKKLAIGSAIAIGIVCGSGHCKL